MSQHSDALPAATHHHPPHPFLFLVLFMPFGAVSGFLSVTLAYELSRKGISISDIAVVTALGFLTQMGKWLWAPLVDALSTRKVWYVGATLVCGAGLWLAGVCAEGAHPSLPLIAGALAVSYLASSVLGMAIESLLAVSVPDEQRGRAAGWTQAGGFAGGGLGGGLALWLVQAFGWTIAASGAALGAMCALCCLALFWVDDSRALVKVDDHLEAAARRGLLANARAILADLGGLLKSRVGILAVLICVLPIGNGAAANLFSPMASEWHASAQVVAFVTGALSGLISAAGSLAGGWLCDRMDRRTAYCVFGFLQVLAAIGLAFSARTSMQFVVWTSLYSFVAGLCYAAYCAVVLEAVGRTAAATKYSFLASLANTPLMYMTVTDGAANGRWGTNGMLWTEAWCGLAGIVLFAAVAGLTKRRPGVGGAQAA